MRSQRLRVRLLDRPARSNHGGGADGYCPAPESLLCFVPQLATVARSNCRIAMGVAAGADVRAIGWRLQPEEPCRLIDTHVRAGRIEGSAWTR